MTLNINLIFIFSGKFILVFMGSNSVKTKNSDYIQKFL